jgi:hypothetical protein
MNKNERKIFGRVVLCVTLFDVWHFSKIPMKMKLLVKMLCCVYKLTFPKFDIFMSLVYSIICEVFYDFIPQQEMQHIQTNSWI